MSHPTSLSHINIWLLLPKPCNGKATRLQLVLDCGNNSMFTVHFHSNPSVLCCKCQLHPCFIGYYFCFMVQFPELAQLQVSSLADNTIPGTPLMSTQDKLVISSANLMIVGVTLFTQVEPILFIFLLCFFGFPFI